MARTALAALAVLAAAAAFAPPTTTTASPVTATRPRAQKGPDADGTKKRSEMTDWEIYRTGIGRAFKFPWEVERPSSRQSATRSRPRSCSRYLGRSRTASRRAHRAAKLTLYIYTKNLNYRRKAGRGRSRARRPEQEPTQGRDNEDVETGRGAGRRPRRRGRRRRAAPEPRRVFRRAVARTEAACVARRRRVISGELSSYGGAQFPGQSSGPCRSTFLRGRSRAWPSCGSRSPVVPDADCLGFGGLGLGKPSGTSR